MTIFTRDQLDSLVKKIRKKNISQVYLLFGERYLCQQAAEKITQALLEGGGTVNSIDGSQEDFSATLGKISSFSLFPGRQVFRINDTRLFHSSKNSHSLWKKAVTAYRENNRQLASRYLRAMLEAAGLKADDPDNDPGSLSGARWKKLFGFAKPQENPDWTEELLSSSAEKGKGAEKISVFDPSQLFAETITSGLPRQNVLLLLTEDVDKRKLLFKLLADQFALIDLSVEAGSSSRAQKSQHTVLLEVLSETLARYGKTMTPDVADLLFERVGFHPVAVAMEAEKLALFAGSRTQIQRNDIDSLIGRTRQEALFELTEALGKMNLERSLVTAERLQENGIHPLAIIATIRNYLRTLLLFRSLQEIPETGYSRSMSPALFQQQCLPRLKQKEQWKKELSGHPYAVYMQFKTASAFQLSTLKAWMNFVLRADFRLKGSHIAPDTIIQHLIINMLGNTDNPVLKKYHGGLH
ncbi:MAG: hypothetical protein OEM01_14475 [Desulfobulbaceae bacterium]|nr:hypothetical protein [Desulfobulbaceae bacterium]